MRFRSVTRKSRVADNPADFFQSLRPRKIAALYDQQAQLLRDYADKAINKSDVAIQGATGSGKTVVGLVIAEWRRRKFQERPVYLCPTHQLVYQVEKFAKEQLGLPACAFVGSKHAYPQNIKTNWRNGEILAISTYSAVFNINPFFSQPNFIIVDDAHASDQYIGEYWTLRISKKDSSQKSFFNELADSLYKVISADEYNRLCETPRTISDNFWVQLVPTSSLIEIESEITSILDQAPSGKELYFKWRVLKDHLKATQLFISPNEILFRPIIPPTGEHAPFKNANQRLYMSATLGRGGELERLSGRKSIKRLPSPPGWDGHGVGRRFFIFPNATLNDKETNIFLCELIKHSEPQRALFLTSNERSADGIKQSIGKYLQGYSIFSVKDIESSKDSFVNSDKAVTVIANRYDGIDFPDDECRILVVSNKPSGMNLLERYFTEKLCARALFAERIRTRIIQAFGRCTRSAKDYAIVCVLGDSLMDDLLRSEWQAGLDRELQAEIKFGAEQSKNQPIEELIELSELFFDQGPDWRSAEEEISSLKEELEEKMPDALGELEKSSKHEIDYINALWREDYEKAVDAAQCVIEALSGGNELKGYRGMWHYLAGSAAYILAKERGKEMSIAYRHFQTAKSITSIRNLPLEEEGRNVQNREYSDNQLNMMAVSILETFLLELGLTNRKRYSSVESQISEGIHQDEAKDFESAHEKLGELLGFNSWNPKGKGAPDPVWIIGDNLCFVFEDHIKNSDGMELSIEKARQAASHPKWIRSNINILDSNAEIIPVLITNADATSVECRTQLEGVAIWSLVEFREWTNKVLGKIRRLRIELGGHGNIFWREKAIAELDSISATPSALKELLRDNGYNFSSDFQQ